MEQQFIVGVPLLTHDGTHLAFVSGGLEHFGENPKPYGILLLDLADFKEREVRRSSWWDNLYMRPTPLAFAPDDRALAVKVLYRLFGSRWYDPVLKWLLEPDRPVHLYDVGSGRCLARLLGDDAIFTPDGKAVIIYGQDVQPFLAADDKPVFPTGDLLIRAYDYPVRTPVLAILSWHYCRRPW